MLRFRQTNSSKATQNNGNQKNKRSAPSLGWQAKGTAMRGTAKRKKRSAKSESEETKKTAASKRCHRLGINTLKNYATAVPIKNTPANATIAYNSGNTAKIKVLENTS